MEIAGKKFVSANPKQNVQNENLYNENGSSKIRLVLCFPGNRFSGEFIKSFGVTITTLLQAGVQISFVNEYSSVVHYARNKCLGGNVLRGKNQKPYDGKLDYTHLMWIDSDMVWKPQQILALLNRNVDVVSGVYRISPFDESVCAVQKWDKQFFLKNGHFKFMTMDDIKKKKDLIKVSYTGFGFMLIKKGVFEKLNYPWFNSRMVNFDDNIEDFSAEDVSFCQTASEKNITINLDPTIIVGHEKSAVL